MALAARSLGPNTARRYEQVLSANDGFGLEIDEMLVMVETLDAFIRGHALDELSEHESARRSGLDQEQWMQLQTPYIESLINSGHPNPSRHYPHFAWRRFVPPLRLDTFGLSYEGTSHDDANGAPVRAGHRTELHEETNQWS